MKGRKNPYIKHLKQPGTIRLDKTTIACFTSLADELGMPYQSLINLYLRDCAQHHRKLEMKWSKQAGRARTRAGRSATAQRAVSYQPGHSAAPRRTLRGRLTARGHPAKRGVRSGVISGNRRLTRRRRSASTPRGTSVVHPFLPSTTAETGLMRRAWRAAPSPWWRAPTHGG